MCGVGDAAAGLGLHSLHMSKGPFSHDAGQLLINASDVKKKHMQNIKVYNLYFSSLYFSHTKQFLYNYYIIIHYFFNFYKK